MGIKNKNNTSNNTSNKNNRKSSNIQNDDKEFLNIINQHMVDISNSATIDDTTDMCKRCNTRHSTDKYTHMPLVSVCTPTFNRRPFIPGMLKCFDHQTYPKCRMEWIIIDDGTDLIEELVINHPNVKYFKYDTKLTLGKKRNLMHDKSKGDILVYMDDDDYYPPERVSHAVERLQSDKNVLCAGSSEIYIYFKHIKEMYQFGPYGPKHATAGTFAFKRRLLETSRYDDTACLAEEKAFLKDYTVPFIQLEPIKTILVFSHEHNTFDKRKLLENRHPQFVKPSTKTVDTFVKDASMKDFYMNIDNMIADYSPGKPCMKPDVLEQMIKIEENRRKQAESAAATKNGQNGQIVIQQDGKEPITLNNDKVVELLKHQQSQLQQMKEAFESLSQEHMKLKQTAQTQTNTITELQKLNTILLTKIANK